MTEHITKLKKAFLNQGYQEATIDFQFNRLNDCKEPILTESKEQSIETQLQSW